MEIIDDEGRLFGLVNVVDVVVVVLTIAVVVAGLVFVFGSDERDPAVRYATVDLGEQPGYVTENIDAGDVMDRGEDNLTITDVYRGPAENGSRVIVRTEVNGERVGEERTQFQFGGEPFRGGHDVTIETPEYSVEGTVTGIDPANASLPTDEVPVAVDTTLPPRVADELAVGDTYDIDGHTVATIESLRRYPTPEDDTRTILGMTLSTVETDGSSYFGQIPIRMDTTIPIDTGEATVEGDIIRIGSVAEPGESQTRTVTLQLRNVRPERADRIEVGMTESIHGDTLAEITNKTERPAEVILESEDGNIYLREHPRNLDLELTADLQALETETDIRFHGDELQEGDEVVLDLGRMTITADVISIHE